MPHRNIIDPTDPPPDDDGRDDNDGSNRHPPARRVDVLVNGLSGWMGTAAQFTAVGAIIVAMLYQVFATNSANRELSRQLADFSRDRRDDARDFRAALESVEKHDTEMRTITHQGIERNYKMLVEMQRVQERNSDLLGTLVRKVQGMEMGPFKP